MTHNYYKTSCEHLTAEMGILDILIRNQYLMAKHHFHQKDEFHGMYISDEDVEQIVMNPLDLPVWARASQDSIHFNTLENFEVMRKGVAQCVIESRKMGALLRLDRLAGLFCLDRSDLDILLVCLAPELSSSYSKIYAYLQDDLTKKKPSVDLVLNILGMTIPGKIGLMKHLRQGSPLIDHRLVLVERDPSSPSLPFISRFLSVDSSIVMYLLGEDRPDEDRMKPIRIISPEMDLDSLILDAATRTALESMTKREAGELNTIFYFYGPYGTGKKSTAEALCHAWNKMMWVVDVGMLAGLGMLEMIEQVIKICRDACVHDAGVYWDRCEVLFQEDKQTWLHEFMICLDQGHGMDFVSGSVPLLPRIPVKRRFIIPFEFACPSHDQRMELWMRALDLKECDEDMDVVKLSAGFSFSGGQIRDAVNTAKSFAIKNHLQKTITTDDLRMACLLQSGRGLSSLARRIRPAYSWDDIVLPPDRIEQLQDIVNHARFRSFVMDTWGFGKKLSGGKGLNVLFAGPSGTGKTMAAEIMASDLGLHLYKIDLARVVSKYIGETEKNLSRIFEEAETSSAILFFDEADAIFGKRSDVHDAHDRYANIETSYLLQKMEEYEGVTILATNFRRNMDDAFVRRIQYAVEFPFPEKHDRKEIWKKTWPRELPLAPGIDFDLLAGRFEMSGGNIKNICVNAAFIAAADGRIVTMNHLMRATRNEYRKMGKLMMNGEFSELRAV